MGIDVLFIHPGNQKKNYQELSNEFTAIATPVWTALLAQYIRAQGYTPVIYDVNVEGWDAQSRAELLQRYSPRLIVMMVYGHNPSASTQVMPAAGRIARDIEAFNKNIPVAMGGLHPSALPERTLREEAIDFVIQGEGPYTIKGLLDSLTGKLSLREVPGLWYRNKEGVIENNGPSAVVGDLDKELPGYAWDLLPALSRYRAHNMHCFPDEVRSPYATIYTSLGCPYSCHYCCINALFGKPGIRYWQVERVVGWIEELCHTYKVKNIRFEDELFILSPERVERFCDLMIEKDLGVNIWAYGRVDTIPERLLEKLKKAGVNWI